VKLFTCTDHDCVWPVCVASIVLARNEDEARTLLDRALINRGLKPFARSPYTLTEIEQSVASVYILADGEY
jgi:hypothetical protein